MPQTTLSFPSPVPRPSRRTWLGLAAAAVLAGCTSPPEKFQGTFLQPWKSYEALSLEEWRRRLRTTRALGCDEIVLQWSAAYGGASPWDLPDTLLTLLFDEAGREGMGIRMGLPYDERWWTAMGSKDPAVLPAFLADTQARSLGFMQSARWSQQAGFRGWYLPYELDQYNWATAERRQMLVAWLQAIAAGGGREPLAVSTFFSRLSTPGTLTGLWSDILDQVRLRPMLQDGVGVAGMGNYAGLEPLRALLRRRGVPFDLIVELFEQLPALPGTDDAFRARAASAERVKAQLRVARSYGAERIIAFAIDPWMLGDTAEARQLLKDWGQNR
ncbi:DUF4434 domain-containing protein [Xylophilus sp. Leaf220]|uniref:DUF4434 domain-containing protein n=1 Tax=Xylophilus sp. Leaf220 TaxID=1735686 RepID=UPI0006F22D76|nr:DUF4434 domain-containing protein [Xylophilus sp. Leaf220]KQM70205.1 Tat pathway signal protein [Xylophilus sp. Leaf220]